MLHRDTQKGSFIFLVTAFHTVCAHRASVVKNNYTPIRAGVNTKTMPGCYYLSMFMVRFTRNPASAGI